jgi:OmpA-OmpF porin, OOP family
VIRLLGVLPVALCLLLHPSAGGAQDISGSQDHPLVTRMPGYEITGYVAEEFGSYEPTIIGGKPVTWEGRKYAIDYSIPDDAKPASMLQIVRNYEAAVKQVGGRVLGGDERRLAAEIRRGPATTGVYVEAFNEGRRYTLVIVESGEMRQDVVADAAAMGRDLAASGRTIVHGIHFDTGSAAIRPDSEAALVQMVALLQNSPSLKVFIVGHTDTVGALETNLRLSGARAEAVVKALAARGIAAERLQAFGAGPYAPVASNRDDEGRAKNRRVELVER